MTGRRRMAAVLRALVPGCVLACGDPIALPEVPPIPPPGRPDGEQAPGAAAALPHETPGTASLIACLERTEPRIERMWERLTMDVDPRTGRPLRPKDDAPPHVPTLRRELEACVVPTDDDASVPDAVRDAARQYVDRTAQLASIFADLGAYYDADGYENDGWTYSVAAVPAVATLMEDWREATFTLDGELRGAHRRHLEERSASLPSGSVQTQVIEILVASYDYVACLEDAEDPNDCHALRAALEGRNGALDATLAERDGGSLGVFWAAPFRREAQVLLDTSQPVRSRSRSRRGRWTPPPPELGRTLRRLVVASEHVIETG